MQQPMFDSMPAAVPRLASTLQAAQVRLAGVRPQAYARTRNAIDGAVTGLSPYLTHGLLSLPEVLADIDRKHALDVQHKLVFELGWRAYFRHVWQHRGDGILVSLRDGPLPESAYATELPADIRNACTGLPVIDTSVRSLYATGTLHNHARMWLASYVVPATTSAGSGWPAQAVPSPICSMPRTWRAMRRLNGTARAAPSTPATTSWTVCAAARAAGCCRARPTCRRRSNRR